MKTALDLSLYLVTDPLLNAGRPVEEVVAAAIGSGVTIVQFRDPVSPTRQLVEIARRLLAVLEPHGIPLIVNDRVDVAVAADADGVHLGQGDMDPRDARRLIGPDRIIGLSVGNRDELERSRDMIATVDYLGVGPVFATATKSDAGVAIGLDGIGRMRAAIQLPIVGIGGIDGGRAESVIRAGADGVAIVTAIMQAADPGRAAAEILDAVQSGRSD
jgi:thiamine-phosphate pyrophosphorylase